MPFAHPSAFFASIYRKWMEHHHGIRMHLVKFKRIDGIFVVVVVMFFTLFADVRQKFKSRNQIKTKSSHRWCPSVISYFFLSSYQSMSVIADPSSISIICVEVPLVRLYKKSPHYSNHHRPMQPCSIIREFV